VWCPGLVYSISGGLDGFVEALPDFIVGAERGEGLVGHVLREAFFEPEIVEPAHGGEVAEPLMGELVQNEDLPVDQIRLSGRGAEEHRLLA